MKKAAGSVLQILKGIFFIGFGVQILLGAAWTCCNFTRLQEFSVSGGFLYQALRALAERAFVLLYVVQLALAGAVGYAWMGLCHRGSPFLRAWGTLCLLTFPMALQCHLAVSPYSLSGSLFLLELFFAVRAVREEDKTLWKTAGACACWMALTFLLPEYFLLGLVPVLLTALLKLPAWRKELRRLAGVLLLAAAFGGLMAGIRELAGGENPFSRENAALALFSRMGWPTIWNDAMACWTDDEIPGLSVQALQDTSNRAEDFWRVLKPLADEAFTADEAAAFFLKKASVGWILRPGQVLKQCVWDGLCYVASPVCLPAQLRGFGGATYSGRNYELMLQRTPRLSGTFMRYGCWWFTAALPMAVLAIPARRLASGRNAAVWDGQGVPVQAGRSGSLWGAWKAGFLCALSAAALALLYTMRGAGRMDYKCTVAVVLLWLAWMQGVMRKDEA